LALPAPSLQGVHAVDVVEHYNYPRDLDGSGQRIALIALGGELHPDELQVYCTLAGLPTPTVTDVPRDDLESYDDDVMSVLLARDLQLAAAAAPGAEMFVHRVPNNELGIAEGLAAAVSRSPSPTVLCISWAIPEDENRMLITAVEDSLKIAALRGISVCAAVEPAQSYSGSLSAPYPAASQYVLACGPTCAVVTPSGEVEEAAVKRSPAEQGALRSRVLEASQWQKPHLARGSGARAMPDVSCLGDDATAYRVFSGGEWLLVPGAAACACLWAGLIARLAQGMDRPLGWLTADLDRTLGPAGVLRRVAGTADQPGDRRRWDAEVGWGSPDGDRLLAALRRL
jgi:kumamolisin